MPAKSWTEVLQPTLNSGRWSPVSQAKSPFNRKAHAQELIFAEQPGPERDIHRYSEDWLAGLIGAEGRPAGALFEPGA